MGLKTSVQLDTSRVTKMSRENVTAKAIHTLAFGWTVVQIDLATFQCCAFVRRHKSMCRNNASGVNCMTVEHQSLHVYLRGGVGAAHHLDRFPL